MRQSLMHKNNCLPFQSHLRFHASSFLLDTNFSIFAFLHKQSPGTYQPFSLLRLHQSNNSKVIRAGAPAEPELGTGYFSDNDEDSVLETCITRTLPPAVTLEHGLEKIKEEVDKLKLDPPCSDSGILRIQIAVPPSAKSLNWFSCQPLSSGVFPQFFMSKETLSYMCEPPSLDRLRGVFGIGSAVSFIRSPSFTSGNWSSLRRFLSVVSPLITAYGFTNITFDSESLSMRHQNGSLYLFIPQIELDEYDCISILAATLAWGDSSDYSFQGAVNSFELSFYQACHHFRPAADNSNNQYKLRKFGLVDDVVSQMIYLNALSLDGNDIGFDPLLMKEVASPCQFCVRFSPAIGFSSNMLDHSREMTFSVQNCANINSLWASLIIEEFVRLGLTYFCIAPGSRSTPLSIAASTHSLTTCIACYDERSLAFHAVGYGRGSHKPAIVITSSGTAVSNLLPAVVEASQDFVPLLLLTADRPPELQDSGANQSINQVNHFGYFVRYFFSLPVPTDDISARMVVTTIDSAVFSATSTPRGPAHINCPFREPLENRPWKWNLSCLKGLENWMSSGEPFTKYIWSQHFHELNATRGIILEVIEIIQGARKGVLLIGAMHTEDELWAALLLAKHLMWPIVADILSGLRLRKILCFFPEVEDKFIFIDHFDHALLSAAVRIWAQSDVIIQLGSRITSKRVAQTLEEFIPRSFIMVGEHSSRHDPSHIITHRIQSTITQFADYLLKARFPYVSSHWCQFLQALDMMVAREISFQIDSEYSLTEPHVANIVSQSVSCESALFVGNSMAIRNADMYGRGSVKCTHNHNISSLVLSSGVPYHGIQVAGNRGASGIDGLLSTAIGFAVGCNKRVICLMGDVSFLHDTNGLALLNQRVQRKPMTILVTNNHGGAIFSFLPIAEATDRRVLSKYFYTSHEVSIRNLCVAHGVKHMQVRTKVELEDALYISQGEENDCLIEVESCIDFNLAFHSKLRKFASQAADQSLNLLSSISVSNSGFYLCKIQRMTYSLYRVQLCSPPTSASYNHDSTEFYREGFILTLFLEDGSFGFGEAAPLEIHKETLPGVEEQLRFLLHVIEGTYISCLVPSLKGSFSSWIWNGLGIKPSSIFPSVRCGLEMAILNAVAARQGSTLVDVLDSQANREEEIARHLSTVQICALLDSNGTPMEVAHLAATLVEEGFTAIKLKVARRLNPMEDVSVIQEVRKKVGSKIELRADANRKWSYSEAIHFGLCVRDCHLQYIEEPVKDESDIIKFCKETGLPVALDETIDNIQECPLKLLSKFSNPGIVAIVIKPSVVGGLEKAALIARWAQQNGKMAIVSAAFESGFSLSTYVQFALYLDRQNKETCRVMNKEVGSIVAHGLGTYRWLKEDVATEPFRTQRNTYSGFIEVSIEDSDYMLKRSELNRNTILRNFSGEKIHNYWFPMDFEDFSCSLKVKEIGVSNKSNVTVFLHGFLGSSEDWIPIMKAISGSTRCISVDLPGHGESKIQNHPQKKASLSIEVVAKILCKLIDNIAPGKVTIVGYSMGARIALFMSLRRYDKYSLRNYTDVFPGEGPCVLKSVLSGLFSTGETILIEIKGAVIISGSPGIKDAKARKLRRANDDSRARSLISHGLKLFLDNWYTGELWKSLRGHPHFSEIVASRMRHDDMYNLAKALSDLSTGRQPPLWGALRQCKTPLLLIVGEQDKKFKRIAEEMAYEIANGIPNSEDSAYKICEIIEIPSCGHAAHLENPLSVIAAMRQFSTHLERS